MKRYLADAAIALMVLCAAGARAAINDMTARFSTPGVDYYADGKPVADGECYALVWSPKGAVFSGFNADGTAVSSADRVVLAGPLAKDGRCVDSIFHIPAALYSELDGGEWAVCLVDTRTASGVPAGAAGGKPLRVNRWGIVSGGVEIAAAGSVGKCRASASGSVQSVKGNAPYQTGGVRAGNLSAVPPNLPPPRITAMDVSEGVVRLAVSDTVPYLTYTVSSSSTPAPGGFSRDKYADRLDGSDDSKGEIVIETDAHGGSRFFKVTRAE